MSFFEELKRRNVFRVGIAYAVGAWLLLQLTDVLSELLTLPPQVGPTVVTIVLIGFPVVLFAAWAYELTPQGLKRESEVQADTSITRRTGRKLNGLITVMLAVAVAYLLYDKFLVDGAAPGAERAEAEAARAAEVTDDADDQGAAAKDGTMIPDEAAAPAPPRSIAVLPFTNRSPLADDEFFIDGIHDDLLTNLARIGGLKVISRTSVARFRDTQKPIPEIARELDVATVMEGAVQRAGDTVRINVQLIDAATDEHLWAQIYDRPLTTDNLFAIQSEISGAIAEALEAQLTPDEAARVRAQPTDSLEAYNAYLRGLRDFESREIETMERALASFQRAVELDPEFAEAWAGLAQVATVLPSWGMSLTREEGRAIAEPAAERAMALAPDSGEAQLALAVVLDGEAAIEAFEPALERLPNHPMAHLWAANALQGPPGPNWLEALALLRKAVELDPLGPNPRSQLARQLLMMNRSDEAERQLRLVMETNPEYAPALGFMAWATARRGDLDESLGWSSRYLSLDPRSGPGLGSRVDALTTLRDRERLESTLARWQSTNPDNPASNFLSLRLALMDRRFGAALEQLSALPDAPGLFDAEARRALIHTYAREYDPAMASWRQAAPGLWEESARKETLVAFARDACVIADVARRVGEDEWAEGLAREARDYIMEERSRYMEHAAGQANLAYCHAVLGDYEAALSQLETNLRHRHFDSWWEPRYLELFDPLSGDRRFEDLMQAFEDEMARQRASLDRIDRPEATGP